MTAVARREAMTFRPSRPGRSSAGAACGRRGAEPGLAFLREKKGGLGDGDMTWVHGIYTVFFFKMGFMCGLMWIYGI